MKSELENEIDSDRALAIRPEHSTKLFEHGFRTRRAILIIHGLHESPYYMKGIAQYFESKGYNVLSLRLPGHFSKNPEDIHHVTAQQWIAAAEKAFLEAKSLGEQVEIMGYSTGGTLAAYLALKYPSDVKALYLISPALALKSRVFLTTLFSGFSGLNLNHICNNLDAQSQLCRIVLYSDSELKLMLDEGLISSLAAGAQVQVLINIIANKFGTKIPQQEMAASYYQNLKETYLQMHVPLVMVNTGADQVVQAEFNQDLFKDYHGQKSSLFFPKSAGITHLMMNKAPQDAFRKSAGSVNPQFEKILEAFDQIVGSDR